MMETFKQKSELVAVTITDIGEMRKWHRGDVVTLRWSHAGRSGEGEFRVVDAKSRLHSAIVDIELEPVS